MDIIVHSLYSNRDVFLRELISNSADALDKARFLALTDKKALADNPELEIRIQVDADAGTLEIRDSGVGMTRDDLVNNLGTLARSGTSAFLDALSASTKSGGKDSLSLIGQFGVGFYSAFLVADRVQVISKTAGKASEQWVWESAADGAFTVKKSDEESLLEGRGTLVRLFLKEDAAEYKDQHKLRELVGRYSEFVGHPIFLHESKEESREVPVGDQDEEEESQKEKEKRDDAGISDGDDDLDLDKDDDDDDDDDASSKKKPKTKTVKETVWSWSRLNDVKPIWLRSPADVKEDEHLDFFRAVAKTGPEDSPIAQAHFSAEGDVEFRALLYVPATTPYGFYENYYTMEPSVRLYVRRVFVSDSGVVKDIVPRYLGFLRGVVDSDSLPLSVSRETLQASPALKTIKKKVVRKVLDAFKKMSDAEASAVAAVVERKEKKGGLFGKKSSAPTKEEAAAIDDYAALWKHYGRAIKLGLLEDKPNAARLAKLLRFKTSAFPEQKHAANLTSLDAYVSRMKPGQKQIFYLTGEDASAMARSPFAERLLEGGFEVLLLDDPVDEYMSQSLTEFDGFKLADASKDGLKLSASKEKNDDKDKDSSSGSSSTDDNLLGENAKKQRDKAVRKAFKPLTDWWASPDVLGADAGVARVKVSPRLVKSPAVVVSSQHGWNANMERIMRAQALTATDAGARAASMRGGRTLEVNPRHGLVRKLREMHAAAFASASDEDDSSSSNPALDSLKKEAVELARLVYDSALLESGFSPDDPVALAARVRAAAGRAFAKEGEDLDSLADIELPKEEEKEEKNSTKKKGKKDEL
jgi:heat shock protein 90kDa beta